MDIRNSLDGLKSLLGVTAPSMPARQTKSGSAANGSALASDQATFSSAGNEASQTAAGSEVRMDKVSAIQAALSAGTYNVPASAVAAKMVDAVAGGSARGNHDLVPEAFGLHIAGLGNVHGRRSQSQHRHAQTHFQPGLQPIPPHMLHPTRSDLTKTIRPTPIRP
jgi:flagellar biosynthesis anti-sigma factor FlgM